MAAAGELRRTDSDWTPTTMDGCERLRTDRHRLLIHWLRVRIPPGPPITIRSSATTTSSCAYFPLYSVGRVGTDAQLDAHVGESRRTATNKKRVLTGCRRPECRPCGSQLRGDARRTGARKDWPPARSAS